MKACPVCAEEIQDAALVCRHCGAKSSPAGWGVPGPDLTPTRPNKTSGFAIASMVLGILWIYWIGSILALVFAFQARKEIRESGGSVGGAGMATAGMVLGWVGVGFLAIVGVIILIGVVASA